MKIKVIHVVSSLNINSGVMAVIMNYFRHIDRSKIQFDFMYFINMKKTDTYEEEILRLGGNCYLIERPRLKASAFKSVEEVLEKGYDILHNHEAFLSFFFKPIANRLGIKTFCVHAHTTKFADKPMNTIRNYLLCLPNRYITDYRFACSKMAAEAYFGKRSVRDGHYFLLRNAVNIEQYRFNPTLRKSFRESFGFSDDEYIIGSVGRLCPQKNFAFLIRVFKLIHAQQPKSKLMIVGAGALDSQLKQLAKEFNLEDAVLFLGRRADVDILYNVFDLFVLPSLYEGLGVVLIEAQCNGLTCVTSDVIPEEARILNNFIPISLKQSDAEWADIIVKKAMLCNREMKPDPFIISNGYEISKEAGKLLKIYQRIIND